MSERLTPVIAAENTYRSVIRGTWIAAAAALACLGAAAALTRLGVAWGPYLFLAAPVLLACLVALPVWYAVGRMEQRQLADLLKSGPLAHWSYDRQECARYADFEWSQAKRKAARLALVAAASMLPVAALVAYLEEVALQMALWGTAAICVLSALVVGACALALARRMHHARVNGPPEAYLGRRGVYQHGRYESWSMPWLSLRDVSMDSGDWTVLCFHAAGRRGGTQEFRVLVPAGRGDEAKRLAARIAGDHGLHVQQRPR